jgi:hypothetical protein
MSDTNASIPVAWVAPGNNTIQGQNSSELVQINNTLKAAIQQVQDNLLVFHQQEDVVDGGNAASIQFHYLINPTFIDNGATLSTSIYHFDANSGAAGSATWVFANRRSYN